MPLKLIKSIFIDGPITKLKRRYTVYTFLDKKKTFSQSNFNGLIDMRSLHSCVYQWYTLSWTETSNVTFTSRDKDTSQVITRVTIFTTHYTYKRNRPIRWSLAELCLYKLCAKIAVLFQKTILFHLSLKPAGLDYLHLHL